MTPKWAWHLNGAFTMWSQVQSFDVTVTSPDLAQPQIGIPATTKIALQRRWNDTLALDVMTRFQPIDSSAHGAEF